MRLFVRITTIVASEGIGGLFDRLSKRYFYVYLKLCRSLGRTTVKSMYGVRLQANYDDATFGFYVTGAYGSYYWNLLRSIDYEFVFIDVGANQGLYCIGAALNPKCRHAYAFEPVRATAELLSKNVYLNNVSEKVTVVQKAISESAGFLDIYCNDRHSGVATLAALKDRRLEGGSVERIESIEGGGVERCIVEEDFPLVVKVDVEGHELVVIKELLKTKLSSRIRELFYEVDEEWVDPNRAKRVLEDRGFRLKKIGEGRHYDVQATCAERVVG